MNLLEDPWIPVRAEGGSGEFRLIGYEEVLCADERWSVSLPRDDLELACLQLLVCLTQVIFLPRTIGEVRDRLRQPLGTNAYADAAMQYRDWFDLDHPTQPFMQTRGVKAKEVTPIQKLLIGLPEGNNHAFFNEVGEVKNLGGACAAIALFNQASNSPSFGGGFKGGLRGGAPITTLVAGRNLRETIWRNVVTLDRVRSRLPGYEPDPAQDRPTWVEPIGEGASIAASRIGLARGLLWQPARVELVKAEKERPCDVLGVASGLGYSGFRKEKFNFAVDGLWPHPHGAMTANVKKGVVEWKFASFTTTAPAWTQLSEFVVPRSLDEGKEGQVPAEPVLQAAAQAEADALHLVIGGYRVKQASVIERRHELFSLAGGWNDDLARVTRLVDLGSEAKAALRGKLFYAARGNADKGLQGIGAAIHEAGEDLFYAETEALIHGALRDAMTWREFKTERERLADRLGQVCRGIFERLTDPYAHKPELIPIIAAARRGLNADLKNLKEGAQQHAR
jgi:CRISPR system Cascade subunit CasA